MNPNSGCTVIPIQLHGLSPVKTKKIVQERRANNNQLAHFASTILVIITNIRPFVHQIIIIFTTTNMSVDSASAASTYRDFLFEDLAKIKNELNMSDGKRKGPRGGVTDPFPSRLHEMLEDTFADGQDHIISWQVHGRCFIIKDYDVFARELLPKFFRQTKFSSFKRQMNLYGFRKVLSGTDCGSYYHELFLRGRPDLAMILRRVGGKSAGGTTWRPFQGEDDPDFYALPFCPELARSVAVVSDVSVQSSPNESSPSKPSSHHSSWGKSISEAPLLSFLRGQNKVTTQVSDFPRNNIPKDLSYPTPFEFAPNSFRVPFVPTPMMTYGYGQGQGQVVYQGDCNQFLSPRVPLSQERGPVSFEEVFHEPIAHDQDEFEPSGVELLWAFEDNRFTQNCN